MSSELLVSRTFELQFDWWYTIAAYKIETTGMNEQGQAFVTESWRMRYSNTMDSLSSVKNTVENLNLPDSVTKIQIHQFHVVLTDPNKNQPVSSSSEALSSSEATSSSSVVSSSSEEKSSSSDVSSSSVEESSSSEGTTALGRLDVAPRAFNAREIRRLDGTRIKAGEALVPGVYYVKGLDGRWKKQVELP